MNYKLFITLFFLIPLFTLCQQNESLSNKTILFKSYENSSKTNISPWIDLT